MKNSKLMLNNITYILLLSFVSLILSSCEDSLPNEYKKQTFVEAYLTVGGPINNIILKNSIPISDSISYDYGIIKDAKVKIIGDSRQFELITNQNRKDYFFPDSTYLIKPNTKYQLWVQLSNKEVIQAETTTPLPSRWIRKPNGFVQYPRDTVNIPDRDSISWQAVGQNNFYLLSVTNLDTLNYGKYLVPPTNELNRRVYKPLAGSGTTKKEVELSSYVLVPNTKTNIVWYIFKYFGKTEVALYVPDWNLTRWYLQMQTSAEYSPLLGSIKGNAIGVFGSSAAIRDTFMLLKNQP